MAGRWPRRRATAACGLSAPRAALTPAPPTGTQARIGHFVEAQILEAIGIDFIDESEVLTPADETHHINKHNFKVPVLCGCRNLGEALRRIAEVRGTARRVAALRSRRATRAHARAPARRWLAPAVR